MEGLKAGFQEAVRNNDEKIRMFFEYSEEPQGLYKIRNVALTEIDTLEVRDDILMAIGPDAKTFAVAVLKSMNIQFSVVGGNKKPFIICPLA
jgi:hypothetical protein